MPYTRTGNPPGRPRKTPEATKAAPAANAAAKTPKPSEPVNETPVHPAPEVFLTPPAHGKESALHMASGRLCAVCWPEGWPEGATGLGCVHGSWIRRLH